MPASRCDAVAVGLHWLIAFAILLNLGLGAWMHEAIEVPSSQALAIDVFQWHKSIGLSVILLSLMRLGWRLSHPPPPLPAQMKNWERRLARLSHGLFYFLLLAVPLSGWLYVSAQWRGDSALNIPTLWFGAFEVPHLFDLHLAGDEARQYWADQASAAHEWLAGGMTALLLLHIGAALKHHFHDRDDVLRRMLPATGGAPLLLRTMAVGLAIVAVLITGTWDEAEPTAQTQNEAAALWAGPAPTAQRWIVDKSQSRIEFSGTHAGLAFRGHFSDWDAAIRLDPEALSDSGLTAIIATASATDGIALHDRTLPQEEWFNAEQHPYASFIAADIQPTGDRRYQLQGQLKIKTYTLPLGPLQLDISGDRLRIHGEAVIDRAAVDMGMESDPEGDYVSRAITIHVEVVAAMPPGQSGPTTREL